MIEYVIYCRKSTDENTDRQIQSIPDQIKECMDFAIRDGHEIAKKPRDFSLFETDEEVKKERSDTNEYSREIYRKYRHFFIVKEQKTAKNPGVRPKRNQLIKLVRQGKIKGIISYHPDRQARNMEEGGSLITLVDQGMLDLKYPRFHFEATATGKMMLGFLFVFSKNYTDTISENVTRGNETSVARGKALGKFKHGYFINDEGYHIPDGTNFKLMQQAFHMKIYEEKSNESIGQWLQARGFMKANEKKVDRKNFSRVWADPFYYGIYISGNAQSDLRGSNPFYQPMITEDEYTILAERVRAGARGKANEIRDENEIVNPLPKGLITTQGYVMSHDFPNKNTRHLPNLKAFQKKKPTATLQDVVNSKHIWYKTHKVKDASGRQLSINYEVVEKEIINVLNHMNITASHHQEYKNYMQHTYETEQSRKAEQMRRIENDRHLFQGKLNTYISRNLGNKRSDAEEKVYKAELKKKEMIIAHMDKELDTLKTDERNYIAEITVFMEVFGNMASRFINLPFVRKREFIKIFISNIEISRSKKIMITVYPHLKALFEANNSKTKKEHPKAFVFGADDETRTRNQLLGRQGL